MYLLGIAVLIKLKCATGQIYLAEHIYSLIQTALENKLNVVKYLTFVFESMKDQTEYTATFIDTLLPISESLPKEIRVNKNI